MVIGDSLGSSLLGVSHARHTPPREAVTLEAKRNPQSANEYSVILTPDVEPTQKVETKSDEEAHTEYAAKKSDQNHDPVSQAFLSVADYQPAKHKIDIKI